ncbi:hypothetical protein VTO42DRAFT_5810 [Malbranchea cinnamomea]
MADVAKPSAPAEHKVKPQKPDEKAYKANLEKAEKELAAAQKKLEAVKEKLALAQPNNQDSPLVKRQQELRSQLAAIRQQQQGFKASRASLQEKINALDANIKSRIAEQKNAKSRVAFKNIEEIDREIQRLEKQVDSGTMKLVDEKKALTEISNLRKQRKNFSGFEESQKTIDDLKAQLSTLKKGLDNPEAKALNDKYLSIQKELDDIKAEQDAVFKNIKALRDERSKVQAEQQKAWANVKEIKDTYYKARKAYKAYEDEMYRIRAERQKAYREQQERERKKRIADKKLEEASRPAFTDEILTAEGLIRHFDPTYDLAALGLGNSKQQSSSTFRAEVGRTVDASDIKGVKIVKKEDRDDDYFIGTGGKKGKKNKKGANGPNAGAAQPEKFNLSFGVIEDLSRLKVDPPMSQADVPAVIEKLVEKLKYWKENQQAETEKNIKKAKEEIERLEKEESEAKTNGDVGASKKSEDSAQLENGVAEVTEDLKNASVEDNKQ